MEHTGLQTQPDPQRQNERQKETDHLENGHYRSFLQSLDDSQFLSHLTSFSESQQPNEPTKVLGNSTPSKNVLPESDPFDDSFNEVLLAQTNQPEQVLQPDIPQQPHEPQPDPIDEDVVVGPQHQFGEYDVYFRNKHAKQQINDREYAAWDAERREAQGEDVYKEPIFKGCIIYVNGHTTPSLTDIHRLVIIYGGKFLAFLNNKSAATHIICDRLTPRKQQQFKNCRVVKAKWISDCVAAKQLLDWKQYRLFKEVAYDQQRLELEGKKQEFDFAVGQFNHEDLVEEDDDDLLVDRFDGFEDIDDPDEGDPDAGEIVSNVEGEMASYVHNKAVGFTNDRTDEHGVPFKKASVMDARSPGFLQHFFANSRLHHLSSWKAELKMTFMKRILDATKQKKVSKDGNKTIMHLDFDCFFATASCQKHPEIDMDKQPVAVSHGSNTSDIASCNYVARSFGVRNGMWTRSARKLCKDLIIVDYEFDLYETCASELYNYLISMAGEFDTIYPVSIDEALIDISSFVNTLKDDEVEQQVQSLCEKIRSDVFRLTKCPISIGVSSNVLLAKLSLRKAKPNGFFHLSRDVEQFLDKVYIKDLPGVGYSLVEKFKKDIDGEFGKVEDPTLFHLRQIPKQRLMNVFGPKTGDKLYSYARGVDTTSLDMDTGGSGNAALLGRKSVSVDVNYGIRFDTPMEIEHFMVEMGKEVSRRLQKLGLVGSQVTLKLAQRAKDAPVNPPKYLGMGVCDFFNKTSKLGVATNEWGVIAAELKSLTRILNVPAKELRGIAVMISKLEDAEQNKLNKQQKLPFGSLTRTKVKQPLQIEDTSHFKDPIGGGSDQNEAPAIDWEVFDALPWDIRKELKDEMVRRGMAVDSRNGSPSKDSPGVKVYRQQLLPSGNGHEPKYVRVVESPKKTKTKSRTGSPHKDTRMSPAPVTYAEDQSFDSSVLNALPSSIRDEYLEEIEQSKKHKLEPMSLKGKFMDISEKSKQVNDPIDEEWVKRQKTFYTRPLFLNSPLSYGDMKVMISQWVRASLQEGGPHEDDVAAFKDYLTQLMSQNQRCRCLRLVIHIQKEIEYHRAIYLCSERSPTQDAAYSEWEQVLQQLSMIANYGKVI